MCVSGGKKFESFSENFGYMLIEWYHLEGFQSLGKLYQKAQRKENGLHQRFEFPSKLLIAEGCYSVDTGNVYHFFKCVTSWNFFQTSFESFRFSESSNLKNA